MWAISTGLASTMLPLKSSRPSRKNFSCLSDHGASCLVHLVRCSLRTLWFPARRLKSGGAGRGFLTLYEIHGRVVDEFRAGVSEGRSVETVRGTLLRPSLAPRVRGRTQVHG